MCCRCVGVGHTYVSSVYVLYASRQKNIFCLQKNPPHVLYSCVHGLTPEASNGSGRGEGGEGGEHHACATWC